MNNYRAELTALRDLQHNQGVVERHIDDDHYVRRFQPGDFVLGGAAVPTHALIPAATPRWPAVVMPDGGTSIAAVSFERPSEWRSGRLCIVYWFTAPGGSTNNFRITVLVSAARQGEVLPATLLVDNQDPIAGPVVADTVVRSPEIYTTISFGPDDELFSVRVVRLGADAPDTNVNEFHLLHVRVKHLPARREV